MEKYLSPVFGNPSIFLRELAELDAKDYDGGVFEFYGEDESGKEGSVEVDVSLLAKESAQVIDNLLLPAEILAAIAQRRIQLTPEYDGGWNAEAFDDQPTATSGAYGMTIEEAVTNLVASNAILITEGELDAAKLGGTFIRK